MGYGYIFVGLLFFVNPSINIVDILPDAVGCIFLIIGLNKLADTDGRFYNARTISYYMLVIQTVKLSLSFFLPRISSTGALPATFIFAVLDTMLLLAFFTNLYGGVEYTVERHGGPGELRNANTASLTAFIFVIAQNILVFLPESVDLFGKKDTLDLNYNASQQLQLDYKPMILGLCVLLSLIIGIYFAAVTGKYLLNLRKNKAYNDNLYAIYEKDILENKPLLTRRALKKAFGYLLAGTVFLFDFTVDGINLLPDFVAFLFFLLAYRTFAKITAEQKKLKVLGGCLLVLSPAFYALKTYLNFGINRVRKVDSFFIMRVPMLENGSAILPTILLKLTETVLFIILFTAIFRLISRIAEEKNADLKRYVAGAKFGSVVYGVLTITVNGLPLFSAYSSGLGKDAASLFCDNLLFVAGSLFFLTTFGLIWFVLRVKRQMEFLF